MKTGLKVAAAMMVIMSGTVIAAPFSVSSADMRDGQTLVFVEVRYRHDARFGGGAASVGPAKRARLERAAQGFLQAPPHRACLPCRFDVVAFDGDADAPACSWHRAAFETC